MYSQADKGICEWTDCLVYSTKASSEVEMEQ